MNKLKIYNKCIILCMICVCIYTAVTQYFANNFRVMHNFLLIFVLLLPDIIEKFTKLRLDNILKITYTIFIILAMYLGSCLNLYYTTNFYDNVVHTLFGVVGSIFAFNLLFIFKKYDYKSTIFNIIYVLSVTIFLAVTWECCEYFYDIMFNANTQHALETGVVDTMTDLLVALLGSLVFVLLYYVEKITNKNLLINKYAKVLGDEYGK